MSKLVINGYWNIFNGKLKQLWAKFNNDDFLYVAGRQEERLGRMRKRTGKRREAVEKTVEEALRSCFYGCAPVKALPYDYCDHPNRIASCLICDSRTTTL